MNAAAVAAEPTEAPPRGLATLRVVESEPEAAAAAQIVVIAGEPARQRHLKRIAARLDRAGGVRCFAEPERALESLKTHPAELIVAELPLKDFGGGDFVRAIRAIEGLAAVPVVVVAAEGDARSRLEVLEAGASDVVTPALDDREIVLRVRNLLATHRQQRAQAGSRFDMLETAFGTIAQGVCVFDADGRIIAFNEQLREVMDDTEGIYHLGATVADIVRHNAEHHRYGDPDPDPDATAARMIALIEDRGPHRIEVRLSERKWVELAIQPRPGGGWATTYTDVTPRKIAEIEEHAARRQLEDFVRSGFDWFWETDANFRLTQIFGRPANTAGGSGESLIGSRPWEQPGTSIERDPGWAENIADVRAHRPFTDFRYTVEAANGRLQHLRASGVPVFDDAGKFVGYRGATRVETEIVEERRQKEEEIAQKTEMLEGALENMAQGICMVDENDRIVALNNRLLEMMGESAGLYYVGANLDDILRAKAEAGRYGSVETEAWSEEFTDKRARGVPHRLDTVTEDCRAIEIQAYPRPDGGWVNTYTDVTERRRAEAELARKNTVLDAALENMAQGLIVIDSDYRIVAFNQRMLELLADLPARYEIGSDMRDVVRENAASGAYGPGDPDTLLAGWLHDLEKRALARRERVTKDGRVIEAVLRPSSDGGWVTTYTDVTERRRAQEALARENELLEAAFDGIRQGIAIIDENYKIVAFNDRMRELTPDSTGLYKVGADIRDVVRANAEQGSYGPGDIEEIVATRLADFERREASPAEIALDDGRAVDACLIPRPGGGWVHTRVDVTERKRAAAEIAEKNALLSAAFDVMAQGIAILDADFKVVAYNQRMFEVSSVKPDRFGIGTDVRDILRDDAENGRLGPGDPEALVAGVIDRLRAGRSSSGEIRLDDGRYDQVHVRPRPSGGWVVTHTDLTERKQAERALVRQKELLETAFESMAQGLLVLDTDCNVVAFNRRMLEFMPESAELIRAGANIRDAIRRNAESGRYGPGDAEALVARMMAVFDPDRPVRVQRDLADGRSFEVLQRPRPGGGFVLTYTEITEQRRIETELRDEQRRLHDFVRSGFDWFWELDADLRHTLVIGPTPALTKRMTDEVMGKTPWERFDVDLSEDTRWRHVVELMRAGRPFRDFRFAVTDENGHVQHYRSSGVPVIDQHGKLVGYRGATRTETALVEERQQKDAEIARKNAVLETAFEAMGQGICLIDADYRIVAFNQRMLDFQGPAADIFDIGADFREVLRRNAAAGRFGGAPAEEQIRGMIGVLNAREPHRVERKLEDGRWVDILIRPRADGGWVITHTDVTKRKRAERRLSANRQRLADLVDASFDWFWETDAEGRFTNVFGPVFEQLQMRPEEFLGKTRWEIAGGDPWRDAFWREHVALLKTGKPFHDLRYTVMNKSGKLHHVRVTGTPVFDDNDVLAGYRGAARMETQIIEDRRRSEAEIQHKSQLLEATFDSVASGIVALSHNLTILATNSQLGEILGVAPELLTAWVSFQPVLQQCGLVDEAGPPRSVAELFALMGDGGELERLVESGRLLSIRLTPLANTGCVMTFTDITDERAAAERLQHGQKLEALGQLTGGIAHEFNNLLTSICGFTQMALKKPDDKDRVLDCLQEVSEVSGRAAELTRQMLSFSRKQVLAKSVVDAGETVRGVEKLIRVTLDPTIDLSFEIESGEAKIEVDSARLTQGILNLVNNARHAMPDGGRLIVRCEAVNLDAPFITSHGDRLRAGRFVRITVTDFGTGIEPDNLARLFDPFFTTKEAGKGTGLGLSIVYGMVKSSGGVIHVESALGVGSSFAIYLPLVEGKVSGESGEVVDAGSEPAQSGSATILVAEDAPDVRRFVEMTLEDAGYTVITAKHGVEALEQYGFREAEIDLVVTDVVMPKMGGIDLAKALLERRPDLPIIFMSGHIARLASEVAELSASANFLQKPFQPDNLTRLVHEVLSKEAADAD